MDNTPEDKGDYWGNNYLHCQYGYNSETCKGEAAFTDFFYDENATFLDKGYYNLNDYISNAKGSTRYQRAKMYQNAIIVHMKFMAPEVDLVDVKYTLMDKIAIFGGNFGIFVEITGWSLLGFLNLILLMLKIAFISRNNCAGIPQKLCII